MIDDQFFNTLAADAAQADGCTASAITMGAMRETMERFKDYRPIRRIRVGQLLWLKVKIELPQIESEVFSGVRVEMDPDLQPNEHEVDYADGGQ